MKPDKELLTSEKQENKLESLIDKVCINFADFDEKINKLKEAAITDRVSVQ